MTGDLNYHVSLLEINHGINADVNYVIIVALSIAIYIFYGYARQIVTAVYRLASYSTLSSCSRLFFVDL